MLRSQVKNLNSLPPLLYTRINPHNLIASWHDNFKQTTSFTTYSHTPYSLRSVS